MDRTLRDQFGQLDLLLADAPLPVAPRRLNRLREIAHARTVDLVARRLRSAIGRLAHADDPLLAAAVGRQATTPMLCALVLSVSGSARPPADRLTPVVDPGTSVVPGYPRSLLDDEQGPWYAARPEAAELAPAAGPAPDGSAGLVVPTSWLGPGGWPALWSRAAR